MAATIGQKHKNGFKIVEIWDNHSESLKNNLYNDFKGPEHLLGGMNLENEIDTCQTTVGQNSITPFRLVFSRISYRGGKSFRESDCFTFPFNLKCFEFMNQQPIMDDSNRS